MAEPTAVPGVDPSRVNTPDELAACLDGLRLRRGLSYEGMERAAAQLLSQSGRSRLEPLAKSTVGEIVRGRRLPAKGKLLTFLAVCGVAQADLAQWLAAWERATTADLARPSGAVRVRDARPRLLGVHAAISVPGVPDDVPPQYVLRDVDAADSGVRARVEAAARQAGFVLLVGGSSVGKTRCAFEAVRILLPDWWLVHPAGPAEVNALAQAPSPRTVVWLDELQRYLDGEHGLTGGVVRALLNSPYPIVIIGTLWPDRYNVYTAVPAPGGADPHAREREVLKLADIVRIGPAFSPAEQDRARTAAARDPRLAVALDTVGYGLTQTLAAAPQLVARWEDAQAADPYAWAVLTAALDVARLGARAPLSADLLRAAASGYCTSQQLAEAPGNWFEQALVYVTGKLHGAAAALSPVGTAMGQIAGYTAADYLIQHTSRERRYARVPASSWDAVLVHLRDPADVVRLADSAKNRLLYRYAIPLYRHAAGADGYAAKELTRLLARSGDLAGLRARADVGDGDAGVWLARLLAERGDGEELRARVDAGDGVAAVWLAMLLAKCGDLDGAKQIMRARADIGDRHAAAWLAMLLAERGDLDGALQIMRARVEDVAREMAEQLAELGLDHDLDWYVEMAEHFAELGLDLDPDWAEEMFRAHEHASASDEEVFQALARLLAENKDLDEVIQIMRGPADAGDRRAARELARLQAKRGDLDGLRARADAGDGDAVVWLARLLAERGDLDGLRARADAGDEEAAQELARLLAERRNLDEEIQQGVVRARADAGEGWAALWLAGLLARRGDHAEAEQMLRVAADAGEPRAAWDLADLLAERGDLDEAIQILRARDDAGYFGAAAKLVKLLARRGDVEELRARADAGDRTAAEELTRLLARRGDFDGAEQILRARDDAGDWRAARELAGLLAYRGDVDGLRARIDAGDGDAAVELAELLAEQGRGDEAERLCQFGLNPDGSIACE